MRSIADSVTDSVADALERAHKAHIQARAAGIHFHAAAGEAVGCAHAAHCGGVEPYRELAALLHYAAYQARGRAAEHAGGEDSACLHHTPGKCERCTERHALDSAYADLGLVLSPRARVAR